MSLLPQRFSFTCSFDFGCVGSSSPRVHFLEVQHAGCALQWLLLLQRRAMGCLGFSGCSTQASLLRGM